MASLEICSSVRPKRVIVAALAMRRLFERKPGALSTDDEAAILHGLI